MKEIKVRTRNKITGKVKIKNYTSVRDLAEAYKIPYMTLYMRLFQGWSPELACKTPVRFRAIPKPKPVAKPKTKTKVKAARRKIVEQVEVEA